MAGKGNLRVLVNKLGHVVDLVVDDDEQVLVGVVLGNILVGVLLCGGHCDGDKRVVAVEGMARARSRSREGGMVEGVGVGWKRGMWKRRSKKKGRKGKRRN